MLSCEKVTCTGTKVGVRTCAVIAVMIGLGIIVAIPCVGWYRYRQKLAGQMGLLAGALARYHKDHGRMPSTLRELVDGGHTGKGTLRLPGSGWEEWDQHSGPEVLYLPLNKWDGRTGYVIAVQPPNGKGTRIYLVAGSTRLHRATEAELSTILEKDDRLRAATSQPGHWSDLPWSALPRDRR